VSLDHNFIWLSDALVNQLSLSSNQMSLDQYRSLMHPDDLNKYLTNLGMLTAAKANYTITYRINLNGKEVWVKEKGKRLFEDSDSQSIIGVISVSSTTNFSKTNLAEIDNTQDEDHLLTDLNNLIKTGRIFQFAIINLYNVVEINQKYGRKVGNMIMNQYIAQLRQTLMSESSQIYRLSGLEFAFTITDERKMGTLRQFINTNTQFFNLTMTYGSLEVELKAKIGISTLSEDAHNANELYQNAYRALKTVMLPNYNGSGAYYKDIQS
jgi:diguanylate cyclase (GGDEF)-like protein